MNNIDEETAVEKNKGKSREYVVENLRMYTQIRYIFVVSRSTCTISFIETQIRDGKKYAHDIGERALSEG